MKKALKYVNGKKPFPAQESIAIVGDDTIVLFFDEKAVQIAKHKIATMKQ